MQSTELVEVAFSTGPQLQMVAKNTISPVQAGQATAALVAAAAVVEVEVVVDRGREEDRDEDRRSCWVVEAACVVGLGPSSRAEAAGAVGSSAGSTSGAVGHTATVHMR